MNLGIIGCGAIGTDVAKAADKIKTIKKIYLYDIKELESEAGLESIKAFISERWRGIRPLLWDTSLIQSELQEALYCGLFGVELDDL